jgi:RHS repeat-associated protein
LGNILSEQEGLSARQPFRFASAEYDRGTKLYKMGARYYDPSVGRFSQPDAVGGGYEYVRSNPVAFIDPTGQTATLPEAAAAGAVGTVCGGSIGAVKLGTAGMAAAGGERFSQQQGL